MLNHPDKNILLHECIELPPSEWRTFDAVVDSYDEEEELLSYRKGHLLALIDCDAIVRVMIAPSVSCATAVKELLNLITLLKKQTKPCERCGGEWEEHHSACYQKEFTLEEVKAVVKWESIRLRKEQEFDGLPF